MKTAATLLILAASAAAAAQVTPAKPAATTSATAVRRPAATPPCAKLPELSPKIPALPAGLPCARPLFTISTVPPGKLDYTSPLAGPTLRETLGIVPSSFSLNYIDVKVGAGALAAPHQWYTLNYTGYLVDGTKFDSSFDHGETYVFPYGQHQVILGWDTGLDGMRLGGKRRLFIPYQLAYGPNGKPAPAGQVSIPPKSELIFDIELISQSDKPPAPKTPPAGAKPPTAPPGFRMPSPAPGARPAAPAPPSPSAVPPAAAPTPSPATPPPAPAPAVPPAPAATPAPAPTPTPPQ